MGVTVNINGLSLVHRSSNGFSAATLPDVCKTPPDAKPIPYPNTSYSKDLVKGTTTVFADGGNMCAHAPSEFSSSVGDESGSLGGLSSGTFMKESAWITYSFDVILKLRFMTANLSRIKEGIARFVALGLPIPMNTLA